MRKSILALFVAVALCGGLSAQGSFSAVTPSGDTLMCCINEGTDEVSVSQYGGARYTRLDIPEQVSHEGRAYRVTELGLAAFSECPTLKEVHIPNSVTWIGRGAFSGCTQLREVDIDPADSELRGIGPAAFAGCASLESMDIPLFVGEIGYHAFMGCTGLKSVTFWGKEASDWIEAQSFDKQHYKKTTFYLYSAWEVKQFKKKTGAKHVEESILAIIDN